MNNEIIGMIATAFIVVGFAFSSEKKIRIINALGAALYIVYGILIHSYSNIVLNSILIAVHLYKLIVHPRLSMKNGRKRVQKAVNKWEDRKRK